MSANLFSSGSLLDKVISPYEELLAYEYLYSRRGMNLAKITSSTVGSGKLPSEVLRDEGGLFDVRETTEYYEVEKYLGSKIGGFDLVINGTPSWPESLADSRRPVPILYFRGSISLVSVRSFSVVGARKASPRGCAIAAELAKGFVKSDKAVVTGLAVGIDTAATKSALIHSSGLAVGVIGTPIDECYPKENEFLVERLLQKEGLLISQVPFFRYYRQPFAEKKFYFPERNELMAAISDATVIVEAADTSGTLTQARACVRQGRPLFIMRHCYNNHSLSWPQKWVQRKNVFVVDSHEEIISIMEEKRLYRDCHATMDLY